MTSDAPGGGRKPPSILFLHQNYPAQFEGIARHMQQEGWDVLFATAHEGIAEGAVTRRPNGLRAVGFRAKRELPEQASRYLRPMEKAVINGQAFAGLGLKLRGSGYAPDLICAHSGWGTGSFAKVVWPEARFVQYLEWWYSYPPADGAAPDAEAAPDRHAATLCRNLPFQLDFQSADAVLVPTAFQAQALPEEVRARTTVLHDGVDCDFFRPGPGALPEALAGRVPETAPVVTYATRGMEPQRGFPEFMAAVEILQRRAPQVHVVIAGTDTVHYQHQPEDSPRSYKTEALERHDYDMDRLHFVGRLPYPAYRDLLQRSDAHVYLTRPFVLSWSLVQAMAAGCALVVSDVAPVREALPGPDMARFVDPADAGALAGAICDVLDEPGLARRLGEAARARAVDAYSSAELFPRKMAFFREVLEGRGARA